MVKAGTLSVGDVVTIYVDPHTCEIPEGVATLVEFASRGACFEAWWVHFSGDELGDNYYRAVVVKG